MLLFFEGGLAAKKRAVDFYKKGVHELEIGLQISCNEKGNSSIIVLSLRNFGKPLGNYFVVMMSILFSFSGKSMYQH